MRTCEICGASLVKKSKEAHWQFAKRRFCSRPCADKGRGIAQRVPDEQFKARYRQSTTKGKKILQHRHVVAQAIGRELLPFEQVHHKDHNRLNNSLGNLEVVSVSQHALRHTKHPINKVCVICEVTYTPHKTKRARQQTCGKPECKRALLVKRWEERRR